MNCLLLGIPPFMSLVLVVDWTVGAKPPSFNLGPRLSCTLGFVLDVGFVPVLQHGQKPAVPGHNLGSKHKLHALFGAY